MSVLVKLMAICLWLLSTSLVNAFNAGGHMVISLVAYDQLDQPTRAWAVELLKRHPRFEEDFLADMPPELRDGSQSDRDRWIFARAATWPDVVRFRARNFNRSKWHYVNFPTFLTQRDEEALRDQLTINLDLEPPPDDRDAYGMNILQAYKNSLRILQDPTTSDEDRAVHLCWLLHLAQDSHQPLHSTALFTLGRFEEGDRGGNSIDTKPGRNLHSMWDGFITKTTNVSKVGDYNRMRRRAVDLMTNEALVAGGREAAQQSLAIDDWIHESLAVAQTDAYDPSVRSYIASREQRGEFGEVQLSKDYLRKGSEVCARRAMESGHRLALVLNRLSQ